MYQVQNTSFLGAQGVFCDLSPLAGYEWCVGSYLALAIKAQEKFTSYKKQYHK